MRINVVGLDIVKAFESLSLVPYLDPDGVPTIGWGAIYGLNGARVTMAHPAINEAQADALLERDTAIAARAVMRLIAAPLTEGQFSGLGSFTFNVGGGRLQSSTLRMMLNRCDYDGAADEFPKWRRSGGVIRRGLVRRREAERALFLA